MRADEPTLWYGDGKQKLCVEGEKKARHHESFCPIVKSHIMVEGASLLGTAVLPQEL